MQGFTDFIKSFGATRIAAMVAVTIALVGFFTFIILRVTAPQMTPLFTDLTVEDSNAIIKDLDRQGIAYELKNEGAIILVPKDRVTRLRMKLAEGGLPKGGGVGYEIFDKSDALGATSFVQNINHLRALEGELSRTIRALDRVQAARVHLVIPDRPLFSRDKVEPSASIVLKVRGSLEQAQVNAIRHPHRLGGHGLKPERVSIVDEAGHLLADGATDDPTGAITADERKIAYERRMRDQIEKLVSKVVGDDRARVQLSADFDFNRITQTSDKFDPEGRVVRSSQTREEQSATGDPQGPVTVGNEVPGAPPNQAAAANREQNKKSEEIVNYEIPVRPNRSGRGWRLSVFGRCSRRWHLYQGTKGRSGLSRARQEEIDRIAALVRSAIGLIKSAAIRSRSSTCDSGVPSNIINEPTGIMAYLQFTRKTSCRGRTGGDGPAQPHCRADRGPSPCAVITLTNRRP